MAKIDTMCSQASDCGKPVERLARWPAAETDIEYIAKEKGMKNPAVGLVFGDGSRLVADGEPKWGIDSFA